MINKWILILAIFLPLSQFAQATPNPHQVVAKVNNHVLKQYQVNQLLQLANFLSASRIKPQHQNLLRRWAIQDFRNSPASTSVFYQEIARDFLPRIQKLKRNRKALETYRASLYQKIYRVFQADPAMKRWNYDLMDVVGWYKSPNGKTLRVQHARKPQQAKKPIPKRVFRTSRQRAQIRQAHRQKAAQRAAQRARLVARKRQTAKSQPKQVANVPATQLDQTLAYMAAIQRNQALFQQRSAALAYQNAMSQRSSNLARIQACQIAGNCSYRYEYVPR